MSPCCADVPSPFDRKALASEHLKRCGEGEGGRARRCLQCARLSSVLAFPCRLWRARSALSAEPEGLSSFTIEAVGGGESRVSQCVLAQNALTLPFLVLI